MATGAATLGAIEALVIYVASDVASVIKERYVVDEFMSRRGTERFAGRGWRRKHAKSPRS